MRAAIIAACLALCACPPAVPVVGPVSACVTTVVQDAIAGMTIDQILANAGPGCVADAEQVISILLGTSDPRVKGTLAYGQALAARGLK